MGDSAQPGGPAPAHLIEVCSSACCDGPVNGDRFFRELCRLADVDPELGGTSADGVLRLQRAECLDVCGVGPILRIDGARVYQQISLEEAGALLDQVRAGREAE